LFLGGRFGQLDQDFSQTGIFGGGQGGVIDTTTTIEFTGAGPLAVAGTATDITNNGTNSLNAQALVINTASGTTTLTIGTGVGQLNTITDLNSALSTAGIELTASFNANGSLTFTSSNDAASQTITNAAALAAPPAGSSGSVNINTTSGAAFTGGVVVAAVADVASQNTRAGLVAQYNQIIQQITTTAQDASFNGVNLLNGDSLKLVFNETGKSTATIAGVTFNRTVSAGLGHRGH
jgi:hypothetical protein